MDGATLIEEVETAKRTQLDRLGGTKWLIAATEADLEAERVLGVAAASETAAAETFERWAESEENEQARETFESVAALEREHAVRVGEYLDADPEPAGGAIHEHLRELGDTPERVGGGLVGRPLVSARTTLQLVSFFINETNERRADLFRGLRTDTEGLLDEGATLLDSVCETDDEFERARTAAEEAVAVAYEEFAADLDAMGLDPRSVC